MAAENPSASYHSETTEYGSFSDAPQPPFRLTLRQAKHKSLWDRVKNAAKALSPEKLMAMINDERQRIEQKVDREEELTDDDIDFLNKSTEEQLEKAFDTFKKQYMEMAKIEKTDTQDEIKLKMEVQKGLVAWLKDLFAWVIGKLKEIYAMIKKAVKWCFDRVKELFKQLFSFIAG